LCHCPGSQYQFTTLKDKRMFCSEVSVSVPCMLIDEPQKVPGSPNKTKYCRIKSEKRRPEQQGRSRKNACHHFLVQSA
jgi:hypothetical protein